MIGTSETPYDLRFRFLGVPVRIHPMFWLISAALGWRDYDIPMVALWVLCVLVSILVHEYGHALVSKAFHCSPSIVLWGLGGLCYSQGERQTPLQRLAVLLGGPGAGFILGALVLLATSLFCGITPSEQLESIASVATRSLLPDEVAIKLQDAVNSSVTGSAFLKAGYRFLIWINLMWGLVNLLPLWPLDGGQAAQILLSFYNRAQGPRWGHIVSLLVAGVLAVTVYTWTGEIFMAVFFAYFAFVNYQVLQSLHQAQSMGLYQEDEWWKG
jgi:membrane-associated protease RseP (regulator of RpoE activity)